MHTNKEARMEAKHRVVQFKLKSFSIWLWSHRLRFFPAFVFYSIAEFVLNVLCQNSHPGIKKKSTQLPKDSFLGLFPISSLQKIELKMKGS